MSDKYSIYIVQYPIFNRFGHNYLVLKDEDNNWVAEMHGLATSEDKKIKPIGYLPSDRLIAYEYKKENGDNPFFGKESAGYPSEKIFEGSKDEVLSRWGLGQEKIKEINK